MESTWTLLWFPSSIAIQSSFEKFKLIRQTRSICSVSATILMLLSATIFKKSIGSRVTKIHIYDWKQSTEFFIYLNKNDKADAHLC